MNGMAHSVKVLNQGAVLFFFFFDILYNSAKETKVLLLENSKGISL